MAFVELNINETQNQFLVSGDLSLITKNRRAKYYFLDVLKGYFENDSTLVINYNDDDKEIILQNIQNTLLKYDIDQKDSSSIKLALENYYREKENFRDFSEKARGIWYNDIEEKDFRDFKESIEKYVPGRQLYDKQLLSAFHLAFSQNACNFSVPGSGKTTIVYAAYSYLRSLDVDDPKFVNKLLVIGPLSSFGPWEDEYIQCFQHEPNSIRLSGGMSKEDRDNHLLSIHPIDKTPEITLMSYQSIPYNLKNLTYYLQREGNKVMVILDEAHRIKNVDGGVWAQAALSIARYCYSRVVLTGTPLPNGYEDIYNLFEFIWPSKDIVKYSIYQLKEMTEDKFDPRIEQLINNISPYFTRIRKSHLDLPPVVNHDPILVEMGPIQRQIYDFIENKYLSYFVNQDESSSVKSELTKARFIRLMQAATNPNLLKRPLEYFFHEQGLGDDLHINDTEILNKIFQYEQLEDTPHKYIRVRELVRDLLADNQKVVIWGTFIQNLKDLKKYLADNDIQSELLIGEVPIERDDLPVNDIVTREKIIHEFNSPDSSFSVLIANPFAVSESISLHKAAHHAIYLERTFNATHFIQSKDRIHRVGLERDMITHYYYILSADSIDQTIHRRLNEKEIRMLELIESQEIPLFSENMNYEIDLDDDIKAIIRDYIRRTTKV